MRSKRNKILKRILYGALAIFILMNTVAFFHASKFTHFDSSAGQTKDSKHLSFGQKLKILFLGINNPRPLNIARPGRPYQTIKLKSNKEIECWLINADNAKGTVVLFHGHAAEKSQMLGHAEIFLEEGYNTFLVDFMGSGGSEGDQTTIGFYEAEEVKTVFDFLAQQGEKNIVLFGTSMGAVAILKAISDHQFLPASIIIECPFGTMLETVQARFSALRVPPFPMANLLVFWGGVQNGFNAFTLSPTEYAKNIHCPVLLLYGEKDEKVSRREIDAIFSNLPEMSKELKTYPLAGHENYLRKYKKEWTDDVMRFLTLHLPD